MNNNVTHLTKQLCIEYIESKKKKGEISGNSCNSYEKTLLSFLAFLPNDGELSQNAVSSWQEYLTAYGYVISTINSKTSIINGLLAWCGRKELILDNIEEDKEKDPEKFLTREEYIRLLQVARERGDARRYCLTKVFACTPLSVQELPLLTVEAAVAGEIFGVDNNPIRISPLICKELLDFAKSEGVSEGPVFVNYKGTALHRTQINLELCALAKSAGIEKSRCTPRTLKRLFSQVNEEIAKKMALFATKELERILDEEQKSIDGNVMQNLGP